jgi:hypothetical protein
MIEWFCYDKECKMAGKPFESYRIYLEHFLQSAAHQNDTELEDILEALGIVDVVASDQIQQADNSLSHLVKPNIFVCREPCCHRYGFNFRCKSEYTRHTDSPSHFAAANLNRILLDTFRPCPELSAEQEAARSLRCNARGCPSFGDTFPTPKSYYIHIIKPEHSQGWAVNSSTLLGKQEDGLALPGMSIDAGGTSGTCVNERCPKFRTVYSTLQKMKRHAHSFGHAMTEEDMESMDESPDEVWVSCALEGMEVTEDNALWRCTKRGCRGFGRVFNQSANAKRHIYSILHTTADQGATMSPKTPMTSFAHATAADDMASSNEPQEEVAWVSSEFEGMEVKGMALWKCVKRGCRRFGHTMTPINNARAHANSVSHTTADPDVPMSPETPTTPFATPKSAPATTLLTPMNLDTPVPATPLSPSAGRGPSAAMALVTPTKTPTLLRTPPSRRMIKLRRSSNTSSQAKRRQDELERQNQELEDRVKRLEEQLARVLGHRATQTTADGSVHEQGNAHGGGNEEVDHLYQFVRSAFRPIQEAREEA